MTVPKFSWLNAALEARSAPAYGIGAKGIFAKRWIKQGTMLVAFGGYVFTKKEEEEMSDEIGDEAIQISVNLVLGNRKKLENEDADNFNHSCNPNAGCKGTIFLVAMRNIREGEEVTFDYAMVLHRTRGCARYRLACNCGQHDCRKIITDADWTSPDLQLRYQGYFQWYIEEKIARLNGKKGGKWDTTFSPRSPTQVATK